MSEDQTKECLFVNLAEKLAIQNQVIIQAMDEIIERATMTREQLEAKYAEQVQKTIEATLVSDLTIGCSQQERDEVPKPKSIGRRKLMASRKVNK